VQEEVAVEEMVIQKVVTAALRMLQGEALSGPQEGLLVNLLANLTTSERGCRELLDTKGELSGSWCAPSPSSGKFSC
jgi:hypothetical protein